MNYQQLADYRSGIIAGVQRSDGALIPFDLGNSDFRQFKADIASGATLKDASGSTMSQPQVAAFLANLP